MAPPVEASPAAPANPFFVIVHGLVVVVAVDKVEIPGSNRSVTRWGIDKGIQI
jgi:hypothetical protein